MRLFRADLHIHSCLSPCAAIDMSPKAIVEESVKAGMDVIALCDHNSAENVGAAMRAGSRVGLHVLPGLEINSEEEVHILAVFDTEDQALSMQEIVYGRLKGSNRPDVFGDQVVANEFDEVEGFNDRLLIGAVQMELRDLVREIRRLGGLTIASHVDRPSYSILGQLGFIPEDLPLNALEVSRNGSIEDLRRDMPGLEERGIGLVTSSDAHEPGDIGSAVTCFLIETPVVGELAMAFRREQGRRVEFSCGNG